MDQENYKPCNISKCPHAFEKIVYTNLNRDEPEEDMHQYYIYCCLTGGFGQVIDDGIGFSSCRNSINRQTCNQHKGKYAFPC